ncbi:MAG: hypothetical protein GWP63_12105 [Haliea sp.]|nr:hypothetical protein [Haliea sp.]
MSIMQRSMPMVGYLVLTVAVLFSPLSQAEVKEQKVRLEVTSPGDGGQCQIQAVFKGDHDNCKNNKAKGRDNCQKDLGCVCTRQEKHITWEMKNKEPFSIKFDQGSSNPFVQKGDSECKFKSNKKGKLRCRVKGKDVPSAVYRYSIHVENCASTVAQVKIY